MGALWAALATQEDLQGRGRGTLLPKMGGRRGTGMKGGEGESGGVEQLENSSNVKSAKKVSDKLKRPRIVIGG